jgi:superfamily II DNA or RNA helicase
MVTVPSPVTLTELTWIRPSYIIPRQDFVAEALVPCLQVADTYRCMAGFFDSRALRDIAPGLAEYISRPGTTVRLIASPYIDDEDQEALRRGVATPAQLLEEKLVALCGRDLSMESALANYTLDCLAYLVAAERLQMKISFVPGGLFHPKVWIFSQGDEVIALHGSSNFTHPGLARNVEQVSVSRSWRGDDQQTIVSDLVQEFETLWRGGRSYALVMDLPEAVKRRLLQRMPSSPPTSEAFVEAWERDRAAGLVEGMPNDRGEGETLTSGFALPAGLNYESGDFAHQGRAVEAWERAGRRGILEMATGSGKTATALLAAYRFFKAEGNLLIVVAVPYLPLITQWESEARGFNLQPIAPGVAATRKAKLAYVEGAARRLSLGASTVECLIVSHDLLCDADFQAVLEAFDGPSLLIGDEVHNLGRPAFVNHPPGAFVARLGLSATPTRQFDEAGTNELFDYFGPVVFEFTLKDAIGVCLVPYDYFVHVIELTEEEVHRYMELTRRLQRLGWLGRASEDVEDQVKALLIRRRRILEQATGKIVAVDRQLRSTGARRLHHTLVYASAKGRQQLTSINRGLADMGVRFHQLTAEETSQPALAAQLLAAFATGQLQVLTAMRVLDEGVNIPEIETALIVASTTVQREWVQRRGRVLRKCPAIGKRSATIHDFLVLPPALDEGDVRGMIRSELARVQEFAILASNAGAPAGAYRVLQDVLNRFFT